jgi:hypothetical protein
MRIFFVGSGNSCRKHRRNLRSETAQLPTYPLETRPVAGPPLGETAPTTRPSVRVERRSLATAARRSPEGRDACVTRAARNGRPGLARSTDCAAQWVNGRVTRVHFIECKGHAPGGIVDDDEVELWLNKRIPLLRKQALEHPDWRNLDLHFELWTSGELSTLSAKAVAEAQEKHQGRYRIRVRSSTEIESLSESLYDKALSKVLQQHFFEHPLAIAAIPEVGTTKSVLDLIMERPASTTGEVFPMIGAIAEAKSDQT